MQQMSIFNDSYFFDQLQKHKRTSSEHIENLYSLVTELQIELIKIKSKNDYQPKD